ncbi:hypothetical protein LK12_03280 [Novosphingobium malaysiense]|uniref:HTH luxR-type domain-containing protein n=2 Tax=Novosphingobium malaysiense TaxID=1348853 RepID=A0A0B1ZVX9_9SPHN|nr:hypothetical protein LK12_03280 [Novosphingobium malaysiense]
MLEWGEGIFPQIAHGFLGSGLRARLVVNDERQVLWASEVALALLEPQFPVVIADGALCFERANDPVACQEWLHSVGRKPSRFLVSGAQEDWWVVMNAWRGRLHADTAIYAEFILSHPPYRSSTSGMSKQFGLTPAECDVIDALVRLETPTKIADRLGVSINTVRTHIRRLYGKLGVNTQVQLIRIATAFSAG